MSFFGEWMNATMIIVFREVLEIALASPPDPQRNGVGDDEITPVNEGEIVVPEVYLTRGVEVGLQLDGWNLAVEQPALEIDHQTLLRTLGPTDRLRQPAQVAGAAVGRHHQRPQPWHLAPTPTHAITALAAATAVAAAGLPWQQ